MRRLILACALGFLTACSVQQRADLLAEPNDVMSDETSSDLMEFGDDTSGQDIPFIAEQREETDAAAASSRPFIAIKPGVPYIAENPEGALPCMNDPITDKRGKLQFPVSDTYAHLPVLGQLLTAMDCGPKRVSMLPSVTSGRYTAGSTIWLNAAPSWMLRDALKNAGFACILKVPELDCKRWQTQSAISVDRIADLRPFVRDMEKDACVSCW